ncbi:MAG: DUF4384 domain-containing protein [Treponema sp.]|jgi:hypothetical protein|nr:DUF4384 domain-containing protein [Treponema sp.]
MKNLPFLPALCMLLAVYLFSSCATGGETAEGPRSEQPMTEQPGTEPAGTEQARTEPSGAVETGSGLDGAIREIADHFLTLLPRGRKIAVTRIDAETGKLSEYVSQELEARLGGSGAFTMLERQHLDRVEDELTFDAEGLVSDESAQRIGHMFGAQTIIFGKIMPLGNEWRLAVYAVDVESAVSRSQIKTLPADPRFAVNENDSAELIERAVFELARDINRRMKIAVGRISRDETGTVTDLSEYLKRSIRREALRQKNKFLVSADGEGSGGAEAFIEGTFIPWGGGAEVHLQLVSSAADTLLGASVFRLPGEFLARSGISLLPPNVGNEKYEEKIRLLRLYDDRDNPFVFRVKSDHEDGIYYDGDYLNLLVYAEEDCYFKITYIDAENNIITFYPRNSRDRNFIKAGETRRIPDITPFRLHRPFGEEYILAAAYRDPFVINPGKAAAVSGEAVFNSLFAVRGGSFIDPSSGNVEFNADMKADAAAKCSFSILERK